ncbi:uncharacterized protein [Medicago truncatula]|uniref:uncharacterized protein n=1 Tax=Medicago truncatula TaxID=3880 RepID=UPI000D2F40AB|nr:uncharacterized protein LOC112416741 [Medicago truncatula]
MEKVQSMLKAKESGNDEVWRARLMESELRANASISWQHSRTLWLREGDANSKYFHAIMSDIRRRNTLSSILVEGNVVEGVSEVIAAVLSYFQNHYQAHEINRHRVDDMNFRRLSVLEGNTLIYPFNEIEVKAAVWDCDGYKNPGPDGIPMDFIKDFWSELKGDIMRFVLEFHRNGRPSKGINSTFIDLIPKIDNPHRLNDFCPIALVGCLYKILAKLLANRLRQVMGTVISDTQSAFVKNWQIIDGILVANEVVDEARKLKKELLLFKVDFEKAYDSVDWGYLDEVMGKMAFPTLWRKWIRECISTTTASVLVNGSPTDEFQMKRGLRQGDPLSPFLFLLAAEGVNILMTSAVNLNLFTGYSIGMHNPTVLSHLQFADDTLLLGVKSWANVRALRAILVLFENMSGLNPIGGDARRLSFWDPVIERLKSRLSEWKSRNLSYGGRLTLLKSVLSSLPGIGGLGVRRLQEFNIALLGKWCWRCLMDREGLWFKVLSSRYGEHRGRLREGGATGSAWWREIVKIQNGIGVEGGSWFEDLSIHKDLSVGEMHALGWGEDGEAWRWRRRLLAWEEELVVEIRNLITNVTLQETEPEVWLWRPNIGDVDQMLMRQEMHNHNVISDAPWHKSVPLKVYICAWRLFRNRWPTKDNLVRRGVITNDTQLCVTGCGKNETIDHLIIHCPIFGDLWQQIKTWIGLFSVDLQQVLDHYYQFVYSSGGYTSRRYFLQLIWLCGIWVLWNERNQRLVANTARTTVQLLEKVKITSLKWLKAKNVCFPFGYHM